MRKNLACLILGVFLATGTALLHAAEAGPGGTDGRRGHTVVTVSPLFGWNRNELGVRGPGGRVTTATETAPEYGLFFLLAHRNLVLTDFAFFTDVNDTEVSGNFAFANLYGNRQDRITWNAGAGHLYHRIEPPNEDITVSVPMVKAGPLLNLPAWHLSVNPYAGYAWERIETRHGDRDNDSYLYGITVGWRWRMLGATVKYYYQDSREADEDYQTVRARVHGMWDEHWGAVVRFDYMEHSTSDDTSVLFGPVYVF